MNNNNLLSPKDKTQPTNYFTHPAKVGVESRRFSLSPPRFSVQRCYNQYREKRKIKRKKKRRSLFYLLRLGYPSHFLSQNTPLNKGQGKGETFPSLIPSLLLSCPLPPHQQILALLPTIWPPGRATRIPSLTPHIYVCVYVCWGFFLRVYSS